MLSKYVLSVYYILSIITISYTLKSNLIVRTSNGLIKGKLNEYNGFYYYSFQGIPYAESTAGPLRFLPPVPKRPWSYVLDATHDKSVCPQSNKELSDLDNISEECLYLNVYIPANITKNMNLMPTFVFIHGGGFKALSGNKEMFGPQHLLQKQIIYISINYRLGALGFLSFGNSCGNWGLRDMKLALEWINKNLENFGGDKNKITIGGQSSGAVASQYLLHANKTLGLFQQAILMSGSALTYRARMRYPDDTARLLGEKLGIVANDSTTFIQQLRNIDVRKIIEASDVLATETDALRDLSAFLPMVETMCPDPILDAESEKQLAKGLPSQVKVLAGINTEEGIYMVPSYLHSFERVKKLNEDLQILIPSDIEYPRGSLESKRLAESIALLYFGTTNIIENEKYCLLCLTDYMTDIQFGVYTTDWWLRQPNTRINSNNLYVYEFSFDGELNWSKYKYGITEVPGTAHVDELGYLFVNGVTQSREKFVNERSNKMRQTMLTLFTNFIKYGNPTPQDSENNKLYWPEYDVQENFLFLDDKVRVLQRNISSRIAKMNFWDKVYADYNQYLLSGGKTEKISLKF